MIAGEASAVAQVLAVRGWYVFPLAPDSKRPLANCTACTGNRCGGPGCGCSVGWCHAHYAATRDVLTIGERWPARSLVGVATEASGLCVVDVEGDGVPWMRQAVRDGLLTATTAFRSASGKGFHLYYRGVVRSRLRPGGQALDVKSAGAYVRWTGDVAADRPAVDVPTTLLSWLDSTAGPGSVETKRSTRAPVPSATGECPHKSPAFLEKGVAMAVERISEAQDRVHATVFAAFLAVLSRHGRCGCLTEEHRDRLFDAAQAKGERLRNCEDAWSNAQERLGI